MRRLLLLAAVIASGCASRAEPYRFSSPMLGMADVPPAPLHEDSPASSSSSSHRAAPPPRRAGGWQADTQGAPIRVVYDNL
jgi:hypothetical protein